MQLYSEKIIAKINDLMRKNERSDKDKNYVEGANDALTVGIMMLEAYEEA